VFVEGLVHVTALGDDFYEYREREHALRGRRTGRRYRVGDAVRVAVAGVSIERRQIDFVLADGEEGDSWRRRRRTFLIVLGVSVAHGAETDPVRRSLVVQAVEKASPAVVNVSTEQIVERRRRAVRVPAGSVLRRVLPRLRRPAPAPLSHDEPRIRRIVAADGNDRHERARDRAREAHPVTLADQRDLDATLVGADADADLAVLRVKAGASLPFLPLGTSSDLMIGETVIAIGNPFGLSHTVTTGVVSAIGRSLHDEERTYTDFVQTDASINPGNSGGPLLNIKGELVGINTAIYGKAQGIGFAIPVDRVGA
jgi:serine protease Do